MTRRKPRGLTQEDRALWQKVADTVIPMRPDAPHPIADLPGSVVRKVPKTENTKPLAPVTEFRIGERAGETALDQVSRPALPGSPHMDRKKIAKLSRGKLMPEARIDLHGLTLAQAHQILIDFVRASQSSGRRLVLVITGKGKARDGSGPIPMRRGLLRTQVPQWLSMLPLSAAVQHVSPAHQRHGGGGAYYVYLRRKR